MAQIDPVLFRELPVILQIIRDETWLESERRHCVVAASDPIVRENVCLVVLRIGAQMRATFLAQIALRPGPVMLDALPFEKDAA